MLFIGTKFNLHFIKLLHTKYRYNLLFLFQMIKQITTLLLF